MCGIAGIAGKGYRESLPLVERMIGGMPYRGPDDRGTFGEGDVALGHLRLSIIDTSPAGHQPMESHDGRFVIVFNGEIFNYIELREELRKRGATLRTTGDTEIIMEAYRIFGPSCPARFNGMWAFALYDRLEKRLFCSRDRFGVKPFFYSFDDGILRFASEMKALLIGRTHEPDRSYLYAFFDRRTPLGSDRTVFRGIHHLRPGHTLTWSLSGMTIDRFWQPDLHAIASEYDYGDPVGTVRSLFTDAVKLRLRSDVPVGVCLSGGIDSSAIAMTLLSLGIIPKTFSCIYDDPQFSERSFIDDVNAATGAVARSITPAPEEFFPALDAIVRHHDEPVRMPGVFSHWNVMRCAHGHVTVLLDGQGADEVFGGYTDYFASYIASLMQDVCRLKSPIDAIRQIGDCVRGIRRHIGPDTPVLLEALLRAAPLLRALGRRQKAKDALFLPALRAKAQEELADDPAELSLIRALRSPLDRDMYRTFSETNLPMLLRYEDRNSMAFSMEARTPFLDYRLVEYALGLPYRMKIRGYSTKWVLREALKPLLPDTVYNRRDKRGFPTPVAPWFRGPLRSEVEKRLNAGAFLDAGMVSPVELSRIVGEHMSGKRNHERALFRLLTLDVWLRTYGAAGSMHHGKDEHV
jgi:asparagine synthase (glutamine-hydrolysing)